VDLFSRKRLAQFVLVPLGLTAIFAGIDTVRDTSWVHSLMLDVQAQKLENYVLGPPAAFADWYAHANEEEPEWGARTFAGEFDLLQIRKRISGRYLETSNVVGTESTNVYTLFRGLIEDFTPIGAIVAALLAGVIAQVLYARRHNLSPAAALVLAAFYGTVLYSPIVSFFSYNGVLLAWIVAYSVFLYGLRSAHTVRGTQFLILEAAE
jgi:oligosaccharide repeat unit polymerase